MHETKSLWSTSPLTKDRWFMKRWKLLFMKDGFHSSNQVCSIGSMFDHIWAEEWPAGASDWERDYGFSFSYPCKDSGRFPRNQCMYGLRPYPPVTSNLALICGSFILDGGIKIHLCLCASAACRLHDRVWPSCFAASISMILRTLWNPGLYISSPAPSKRCYTADKFSVKDRPTWGLTA